VDGYEGGVGDSVNEEQEAFQANNGSTQTVEDRGNSTRECEDWTVQITPVKYNNHEANATASDQSKWNTVL
jgi:hypothetical protein